MDPTFALTLNDLRSKFNGENWISKESTLILKGASSRVENLRLDGFLSLSDSLGSGEVLSKKGCVSFVKTNETDDEIYRIRGYKPAVKSD